MPAYVKLRRHLLHLFIFRLPNASRSRLIMQEVLIFRFAGIEFEQSGFHAKLHGMRFFFQLLRNILERLDDAA